MALDAIKRRIPFDRLAHARRRFHDQRIEATSDVAFPTRHRCDIGLHRRVALALGDLGIAACEKFWLDLTGLPLASRGLCRLRQCLGHAHSSLPFLA